MGRQSRLSPAEQIEKIRQALTLQKGGKSQENACKEVGIASTQFYQYKAKYAKELAEPATEAPSASNEPSGRVYVSDSVKRATLAKVDALREQRGLSIKQACRETGVDLWKYGNWKTLLAKADKAANPPASKVRKPYLVGGSFGEPDGKSVEAIVAENRKLRDMLVDMMLLAKA